MNKYPTKTDLKLKLTKTFSGKNDLLTFLLVQNEKETLTDLNEFDFFC